MGNTNSSEEQHHVQGRGFKQENPEEMRRAGSHQRDLQALLCLQAASTSSQGQSHGTTGLSDLSSWCAWKRAMLPRAGWCPELLAEHQPAAWAWPCSIRCLGSLASTSLELRAQLCLVQRGVGRGDPTRKRSPVNQRRARGHLVRCCLAQPRGRVAPSSHLDFAQGGQTWLVLGGEDPLSCEQLASLRGDSPSRDRRWGIPGPDPRTLPLNPFERRHFGTRWLTAAQNVSVTPWQRAKDGAELTKKGGRFRGLLEGCTPLQSQEQPFPWVCKPTAPPSPKHKRAAKPTAQTRTPGMELQPPIVGAPRHPPPGHEHGIVASPKAPGTKAPAAAHPYLAAELLLHRRAALPPRGEPGTGSSCPEGRKTGVKNVETISLAVASPTSALGPALKFACNGTVIEHPEYGEVIQLQGDQRKNICQFLVEIGLAKDDQLKVHGF
ncbi:Eukaryotic translation initiation factor 1 [Anas platyrhynchos]|uniref:Eukaryotic translation initiation factor 1 n=1 Tax=Anas platyrhynchos TaxID=8839 RepID=R0KZ53_ANAPL|nr:Eukaryotic translation initiation factor 1 [Anas platyrhynchos]